MKQNGWIIWQVHLLFPWADGCLLACWQVYDKVFAIFNQVSSFTPISGPAQKQARAEIKRTGRRRGNKFVIKVWMRLFHLIITIWGLFALRLLVSLSPRSSPDLRTQHIIANQLTSQLWYQLIVISPHSLDHFGLLFDRLLQGFQNCQVQSALSYQWGQAWSVTLYSPLWTVNTPNSPDSLEMQPSSDQAKWHAVLTSYFCKFQCCFCWDRDYLCKVLL